MSRTLHAIDTSPQLRTLRGALDYNRRPNPWLTPARVPGFVWYCAGLCSGLAIGAVIHWLVGP